MSDDRHVVQLLAPGAALAISHSKIVTWNQYDAGRSGVPVGAPPVRSSPAHQVFHRCPRRCSRCSLPPMYDIRTHVTNDKISRYQSEYLMQRDFALFNVLEEPDGPCHVA
jgi:hypothetical protein